MTNKALLSTLSALGLQNEEAELYVFLIQNGSSNVTDMGKHLSMTRVTTYKLLEQLLDKKCIHKIKVKKRILYQAEDPKELLARFEKIYEDGSRELSLLAATQHSSLYVPEIKLYSGARELLKIYDDVGTTLPRGGTYFRYTSRLQEMGRSPLYSELRKQKELERLVITSEKKSSSKGSDPNRFIKTVPKDFAFDDNVTMLIYGTKVAHIDFNSNTGVVINSPHLARFQEKIFKLLWKKL